jgi:periplasmic protein CpxP/Spy
MEKLLNKTRILLWAVIALAVLNIATIATVFWHMSKANRFIDRENFEMNAPAPNGMKQVIKENLKLSDYQVVKFDSIDNKFRTESKAIFEEMKTLRRDMINEITSDNPDSAKLIEFTKALGNLHIELKMRTFNFYFSMKKICQPEQQKELSKFFRKMFMFEGMPGPGMGRDFKEREHHGMECDGIDRDSMHREHFKGCDTLSNKWDKKSSNNQNEKSWHRKHHQKNDSKDQ